MIIGNKTFDTKHHGYIMGILNVTPDSFSDGGKYDHLDAALKHADEMIRDGAAIIDVGGESARPGYTLISDEEEIARVTPVIEALKKAGDFFAAGFLYGLTCGYSLEKCGKIGAILSGEVIQVIGTELPDSKWEKIKEDIIMIN